jgi:hypothetical protein
MRNRSGTTLIEVLVSIFVMGIGLLALLTLFPLGALSMAQAIRDDRIAHAAENARSVAEAFDIRHVKTGTSPFDNPGGGLPNLNNIAGYDGPSYPVLVDPFGALAPTVGAQQFVTGGFVVGSFAVPRVSVKWLPAPSTSSIFRFFTLMDDIMFTEDGIADTTTTGEINREGDFSWAYLLRRPRVTVQSVVEMSIVVYNKRSLSLNPGLNPSEFPFTAAFDNSAGTVTVSWNPATGQAAPLIRPNGWILDASIVNGRPHGFFYRVTGVTDLGNNSLELQVAGNNPFKDFPKGGAGAGVVIIMEGVAEVIEVGTGWVP